ncbi:hypothetical protein D3C79_713030 [compost metagenome]
MAQQLFTRTPATLLGGDVQVFEVDAVASQPGRVTVEVHRVADGLAVTLADQAQGLGAVVEQGAFDIGDAGDHFVAGAFVVGKLGDEGKNLGRVVAAGRADVQGHGRLPAAGLMALMLKASAWQ